MRVISIYMQKLCTVNVDSLAKFSKINLNEWQSQRSTQMMRRSSWPKLHYRWKRKLLSMLLVASCFATFALFESLRSRIHTVSLTYPPLIRKPKIAFLFIARNRIPLDVAWDVFFRGAMEDRFSVYVHSRPGFSLHAATTRSKYFLNRQINDSIQVDWGQASMIQAERILLQNALVDPFNERFIFLSDSCIPLYNFSYTYDYIMSVSTSFWAVLTRKHAEIVVQDDIVYPLFEQYCRPADGSKEHNCIPDEHYVQTLLFQRGLQNEITRRSLTHTSWDLSSSRNNERRGWHPVTYKLADATPQLIQSIKNVDNIFYKSENRREWCTSKGKPSGCFLFARKFTRPAAIRLLNMSALVISTEATNGVTTAA
ncbi:Core-2/I-branching beta-1,6-N-acetylglucosaminyltransferase family protein [Striga asiatica]|uniref:Core-2/I-branching beta-1,6-N-acetylglucosaminyltransferase family protein n=1 Tax=Striga asiatica TaxID=4170 RepID=A0A5A7PVI5_STRAF|nr:Core-2/I-branching beta-1,6-N-acetylglucosaminyltransferase family protein [Striga asiatica]